jgi:hypothetical protein
MGRGRRLRTGASAQSFVLKAKRSRSIENALKGYTTAVKFMKDVRATPEQRNQLRELLEGLKKVLSPLAPSEG